MSSLFLDVPGDQFHQGLEKIFILDCSFRWDHADVQFNGGHPHPHSDFLKNVSF